jgi:hypothetical protein
MKNPNKYLLLGLLCVSLSLYLNTQWNIFPPWLSVFLIIFFIATVVVNLGSTNRKYRIICGPYFQCDRCRYWYACYIIGNRAWHRLPREYWKKHICRNCFKDLVGVEIIGKPCSGINEWLNRGT